MTVLLVDDEPSIRRLVRGKLEDQGMLVTVAGTVAEADAALAARSFAVVILDLSLPDGSGLEVLGRLRASGSTSHVIILSGSTTEAGRVEALDLGADDFVVKPFFVRELTARVLAVARRRDAVADKTLRLGDLDIDLGSRTVTSAGKAVHLTTKEFDLLAYLAARPGHVFDREHLLNAVWQSASDWQQAATVTEHIRRLRGKLEVDPSRPELLTTVRGAGYRLDLPSANGVEEATDPGEEPAAPRSGTLIHVHGLTVSCDEAAADILAAVPSAVVGKQLAELVMPGSLSAAERQSIIDTSPSDTQRSELVDFRRGDADQVTVTVESTPADWHGKPARRLRLTTFADSRARFRRLITGVVGEVTDAVIITDLHFHIRSWNAAAERLYGWRQAEVTGRHILDVVHWVGDDDQLPHIWERLEQIGRWYGESKHLCRDGSVVDILGSTTVIRDDAGDAVAIVSVNRAAVDAGRARALELDEAAAARLRQGLADDEFRVHYQPVVDLVDGAVVAVEALARWEHPERGTLLPRDFLDVAERSGVILQLGERVLDTACQQVAQWRREGADINLSVNLSTRQLADPGIVERFTRVVRDSGLDPAVLWLEVTETTLVEEVETASDVLRRLVGLGVGVAIDDFGTGWASLTYLRSFPVHALKIDGSFVGGVGCSVNDTAIIRSILSLGDELDLFVVAEGVETRVQHEALAQLGCSFGQGHLFGSPTPASQVPVDRARRLPRGG